MDFETIADYPLIRNWFERSYANRQKPVFEEISKEILAAIAITAGALWFTNRLVTPKEATWDDVVAEATRGGYQLISTDELWGRYTDNPKSLLLVDTRQEWEYRTGHIKNALNLPIEPTWLSRWRKKVALEQLLGSDKNRLPVWETHW